MFKKLKNDSRGLGPVEIIIAIAVVAAIGFVGYLVLNRDKGAEVFNNSAEQKAAAAECEKKNDKDICKFLTSWKANEKYKMTMTTEEGETSTFVIDGEKSHMAMTMEGATYEVITIGDTSYTKAGDTWYRQKNDAAEQNLTDDLKVDFDEPAEDSEEPEDKTTYKSLGKEACGDAQCFKYQVISPDTAADEKEFIWFDDKDYQLRRVRNESKDGNSEMTFEYGNVSVSEPSPVKDLAPNQHIMPGQTEPVTMPDMSQFQQ